MNARRRLATLGVAVGGVLAGHWLTYVLVSPDAHARLHVLRSSGHAYLGFANDLGLLFALAAFASVFLGRLGGGPDGSRGVAARLVAFQAVAFLTMELLERVTAGDAVTPLFHGWILPIGIGAQCLIAIGGALVIRLLTRAADRVAGALGAPRPIGAPGVVSTLLPTDPLVPSRLVVAAVGVRGPPLRG